MLRMMIDGCLVLAPCGDIMLILVPCGDIMLILVPCGDIMCLYSGMLHLITQCYRKHMCVCVGGGGGGWESILVNFQPV